MQNLSVDILVVEDKDNERASIVEALQSSIPDVNILAVRNGEEALDYLFSRNNWSDRIDEESPKLILMDLEMPNSSGISVLGQIRSIEPMNSLTVAPVVIFSDSQKPCDINESYRCGANSYIIKPLSFLDFQAVVRTVGQYWMIHNKNSA